MELTERQKAILKAVVEGHVLTAIPVPSEKIAGQPGLRVSPATVRNEMFALEEFGYLTHPHTSAGRVPSDLGYRYYIEHLMTESQLDLVETQTVWHQFHQVEAEMDEWLPLAAAVLAQMSHAAALVTRLRTPQQRVKRLELVSVQDDQVLVVLIMRSGALRQRMLWLDRPASRDELTRTSNQLSDLLGGMTAGEVVLEAERLFGLEQEFGLAVSRLMEQHERNWAADIYYEGLGFISSEPEFGRADSLVRLMDTFERGTGLAPLLSDVFESGDMRVVIGSENQASDMRSCSVILRRYGPSSERAGVLGVVGPTRMKYWRALSMVRFMGDLLDSLVEQSLR